MVWRLRFGGLALAALLVLGGAACAGAPPRGPVAPTATHVKHSYANAYAPQPPPPTLPRPYTGIVDTDGDGVRNASDNCAFVHNPGQLDADGDGRGAGCDTDGYTQRATPTPAMPPPLPGAPPGGDYDCAGGSGNGPYYVDGPVWVGDGDPYGLDGDGDGWGCE